MGKLEPWQERGETLLPVQLQPVQPPMSLHELRRVGNDLGMNELDFQAQPRRPLELPGKARPVVPRRVKRLVRKPDGFHKE